jgi:hypothetical protein
MSLELTPVLVCDICGARHAGKAEHRFTHVQRAAWRTRHSAELDGWLTISHGRYRPASHVCPNCTDKPLPKLKPLPRKPKRKFPPCIMTGFDEEPDPTLAADWWKDGKTPPPIA